MTEQSYSGDMPQPAPHDRRTAKRTADEILASPRPPIDWTIASVWLGISLATAAFWGFAVYRVWEAVS